MVILKKTPTYYILFLVFSFYTSHAHEKFSDIDGEVIKTTRYFGGWRGPSETEKGNHYFQKANKLKIQRNLNKEVFDKAKDYLNNAYTFGHKEAEKLREEFDGLHVKYHREKIEEIIEKSNYTSALYETVQDHIKHMKTIKHGIYLQYDNDLFYSIKYWKVNYYLGKIRKILGENFTETLYVEAEKYQNELANDIGFSESRALSKELKSWKIKHYIKEYDKILNKNFTETLYVEAEKYQNELANDIGFSESRALSKELKSWRMKYDIKEIEEILGKHLQMIFMIKQKDI
jgi:hypothetical protein